MSGEEARMTFFNEKDLDFSQGYRLLMGGVSHVLELLELLSNRTFVRSWEISKSRTRMPASPCSTNVCSKSFAETDYKTASVHVTDTLGDTDENSNSRADVVQRHQQTHGGVGNGGENGPIQE